MTVFVTWSLLGGREARQAPSEAQGWMERDGSGQITQFQPKNLAIASPVIWLTFTASLNGRTGMRWHLPLLLIALPRA